MGGSGLSSDLVGVRIHVSIRKVSKAKKIGGQSGHSPDEQTWWAESCSTSKQNVCNAQTLKEFQKHESSHLEVVKIIALKCQWNRLCHHWYTCVHSLCTCDHCLSTKDADFSHRRFYFLCHEHSGVTLNTDVTKIRLASRWGPQILLLRSIGVHLEVRCIRAIIRVT